MFSQACVRNSVHKGRCTPPRQTPPLGRHPPWADTPRQMATAAGGAHPTGMHSCFVVYLDIHSIIVNEILIQLLQE